MASTEEPSAKRTKVTGQAVGIGSASVAPSHGGVYLPTVEQCKGGCRMQGTPYLDYYCQMCFIKEFGQVGDPRAGCLFLGGVFALNLFRATYVG